MHRTRLFRLLSASIGLSALPTTAFAAAGADALATFIAANIIDQALFAFWGISAGFLLFYAARLILEAQSEQVISQASTSFIYAFFGFVTISLATAFADALFTSGFSGNVTDINPTAIIPGINSISEFIITGSAGVFVLIVTVAGLQMISSQGDHAEFQKWQKILVGNSIGVMIMMLSSVMVNAIAGRDANAIGVELAGLAMFVLTIFGFACAAALIFAGVLLIVSVEESLKDRAKKVVYGTLISLVVILILVAVINTFVIGTTP